MKTNLLAAAATFAVLAPLQAVASTGAETFAEWDLNSDGVISEAEAQDVLSNSFLYFDTNHDGYIDANDSVDVDEEVDETGTLAIEFNDLDGDTRVSLAEFISYAPSWIAAMDLNADGVITVADFGGDGF